MEIYILVLLFFTGLFAGVLNAVAGGATFFTFPALMLAGLSPLSANATNFIATAPGNIAALPAFWDELKIIGKKIFAPLIISAIGGLLGAVVLFSLGANIFKNLVPYLMGFATILFLAAPRLRKLVLNTNLKSKIVPLVLLLSFAIASISLPASIIYIYSGEVFWPYALVMAVGAAIGGFTGGKISKSIPQIYLRVFIIVLGTLLTIYYFIII